MNQSFLSEPSNLYLTLERERPRLLRLCTSWLGDPAEAEDVVQETLIEGWRKIDNLHNPTAFDSWLSGIARNMSLRRLRRRGRDLPVIQAADDPADLLSTVPSSFDFEVDLDRADLAILLDQALGSLPEETRAVLIQKYIEEDSYRAIADRLGISENLVAVRLHRGKLALRKVLTSDLQEETAAFGLIAEDDTWQETRIWCTQCGQHRLLGKLNEQEFSLRCPSCNDEPNSYHSQSLREAPFDMDLKSYRPALKHFSVLMDTLYQNAFRDGAAPCERCGRPLRLKRTIAHYAPPSVRAIRGLHMYCHDCESGSYESLNGLALNRPEGRAFFQAHQRLRTLPEREIEHGGVAAIVVSFAGVYERATYDVVLARDSYEILSTHSSDE